MTLVAKESMVNEVSKTRKILSNNVASGTAKFYHKKRILDEEKLRTSVQLKSIAIELMYFLAFTITS